MYLMHIKKSVAAEWFQLVYVYSVITLTYLNRIIVFTRYVNFLWIRSSQKFMELCYMNTEYSLNACGLVTASCLGYFL